MTIEVVHHPLVIQNYTFVSKTTEIKFLAITNIKKDKNMNYTKKNLDNKNFKKIIFALMIITTLIINLGYVQPRDSSKID